MQGKNPSMIDPVTDRLRRDLDFAGFKAISMVCDNGDSFPSNPVIGQWFYHTTVKTLFIYEADWKPMISFGDVTIYVDKTNGTDGAGYGYGSGANAVKSIAYALSLVPSVNGGNVIINVTAENYEENVVIQGKGFSGPYSLTIRGTDGPSVVTGTATSAGADTSTYYLSDNSKSWTANAYASYLVAITGGKGAGQIRLIESNTSNQLRIIGIWNTTPDATSTYKIYLPGTSVTSIEIAEGQLFVDLYNFNFTGTEGYLRVASGGFGNAYYCRATQSLSSNGELVSVGILIMYACYIGGGSRICLVETSGAFLQAHYCWFRDTSGTGNDNIIDVYSGGFFYAVYGTVISNSRNHGVFATNNSIVSFWSNVVGERCRVYSCAGYGVYCTQGSQAINCNNNYYSGNTSGNFTGTSASYAYAG